MLEKHHARLQNIHLKDLYPANAAQKDLMFPSLETLSVDLSRHNWDKQTFQALIDFAKEKNLQESIKGFFEGESVNFTEDRPVSHMAMRAGSNDNFIINGENATSYVMNLRNRMKKIVDDIHSGAWSGFSGKKITDVVHIGIGGSNLGPQMVVRALTFYQQQKVKIHFIANIDPSELSLLFKQVNPETTLFIIVSKSFTTLETQENAKAAKAWLLANGATEKNVQQNMIAVTAVPEEAAKFGISKEHTLEFPMWVGGRFSLWSPCGLSIALAIGNENFDKFFNGARAADQHYKNTPLEKNIPVLLGLLGYWYREFFDYRAHGVVPYASLLDKMPEYLQQVDMESNGKSVDNNNDFVDFRTGPLVFGQVGTTAQHAFFQWLHQGTDIIPCDIIMYENSDYSIANHQQWLNANAVGQADALMLGKDHKNPHQAFQGNRPTSVFKFDRLTPFTLGMLMVIYEHKASVQGFLWGINSFDQFGVELGKVMAKERFEAMSNNAPKKEAKNP